MEALALLVALGLGGLLVVSPILALVALARANRLQREVDRLRARVEGKWWTTAAPVPPPAPRPEGPPRPPTAEPPAALSTERPAPRAAEPAGPPPAAPPPPAAADSRVPAAGPPPPTAGPPAPEALPDFATNLGPRLLIAGGAIACVGFLGLFVRYAW
ncbi:MAG TPA: hypothetical protein VLI67_04600, partial [Vicinamibacteria bacterium]|nr:hypothetical protein [Vicinamibacteria bacterium]